MHPKPLLHLCIDFLVNSTKSYQRHCHDYEGIWSNVSEVWTDLWYLSPCIPDRATQLLHNYLVYDRHKSEVRDVTRQLLTLLAIKTRRISFVPIEGQLASIISSAFFSVKNVFANEHFLQELDVTGVDLIEDMNVLLALLPLCSELTVLKLGGNTTADVLCAARNCPITVLHISERLVWQPRVTEDDLIDIIIGSRNYNLAELLSNVQQGKSIHENPSWPQLSDFSSGYCKVQLSFLLLILVVFTKLHSLASNLIQLQDVLQAFHNLRRETPNMHKLSLKSSSLYSGGGFIDTLACVAPDLEKLNLVAIKNYVNTIIKDIQKLSIKFSFLRVLDIDLQFINLAEVPAETFTGIGWQLTTLNIHANNFHEVSQQDIALLLQSFPLLQDLALDFNRELRCEHSGAQKMPRFENVTVFKYKIFQPRLRSLPCILKMFPKLEKLTIIGRRFLDKQKILMETLTQLQELRILKVIRLFNLDKASLCELPRMTSDRRPWELYASPNIFEQEDIKKIQNCGWTYIPMTEYDLL
ncbi:hypothetical protein OTU49_011489 [Cherax quadricarinatus]|uniref:Uncharacterized protein n=2 Tax=Cherax quadricarinatus TaxID=27406 RepID=A0AAW0W2N0_CHEQU